VIGREGEVPLRRIGIALGALSVDHKVMFRFVLVVCCLQNKDATSSNTLQTPIPKEALLPSFYEEVAIRGVHSNF
jgi:hypothetical protein